MADLLLVTTVCQADKALAEKRLDYLKTLGEPAKKHPLLLVNDGSIDDATFSEFAKAHADSGLFGTITTRKIITPPTSQDWPNNVNHAWRTTAHIVAGMYGEPFDTSNLLGWFYFEPDVLPFNKDFATILEQHYITAPIRQFMGGVNVTKASNGSFVRHMNGAAAYPISAQFYYDKMMLMEGLPWDVAGMNDETASARRKDMPTEIYTMAFGTHGYKREGQKFTATQQLHDQTTKPYEFTLDKQLLHHGCKDGTLIDCLVPQKKPTNLIPFEDAQGVKADAAAGMKWKDMLKKYKMSPANLKKALAA